MEEEPPLAAANPMTERLLDLKAFYRAHLVEYPCGMDIREDQDGLMTATIGAKDSVALALCPDLRPTCLEQARQTMASSECRSMTIDLQGMHEILEILEHERYPIDRDECMACAVAIGRFLDDMVRLETLTFFTTFPMDLRFCALMTGSCRRIKTLLVGSRYPNPPDMPDATDDLRNIITRCQELETFNLDDSMSWGAFDTVCISLATLPRLTQCKLDCNVRRRGPRGGRIRDHFVISTANDAQAMRALLESPSISELEISHFEIATAEAGDIICQGILASTITSLDLWYFKLTRLEASDAVTEPVARATDLHLRFIRPVNSVILESLCRAFTGTRCVQMLSVTDHDEIGDNVGDHERHVLAVLNASRPWNVSVLKIRWTRGNDAALAAYISGNPSLQYLWILESEQEPFPAAVPKLLLDALTAMDYALIQITFEANNAPLWCQEAEHYAIANKQRLILRNLLNDDLSAIPGESRPDRVLRLLTALPGIDTAIMYRLLIHNELNLREDFCNKLVERSGDTCLETAVSSIGEKERSVHETNCKSSSS